jgi:hypothetical protein
MDKTQQLADRLRHVAAAFVTGPAALRYADLCPELLLIKSKAAPDFPRIQHSVEQFHKDPIHVVAKESPGANTMTAPIPLAYL